MREKYWCGKRLAFKKKEAKGKGKDERGRPNKCEKCAKNSGKEKRQRCVQFMINSMSLILSFILLSGPL